MAVLTVTGTPVAGVRYTVTTANSADWTSVSNSTYFFDLTDKLVHYKDVNGSVQTILAPQVASVQTVTSSATVTPVSTNDEVTITAQAVGLTLANPTGTFTEGQAVIIRVKDNGTAQTIAYGTSYRGTTLPTTTTVGTTTYIPLIYNSTDGKFDNLSASGVLNTIPWFQTIACSDLTTALTAGTTKAYFRCPYAVTLTSVSASVLTAPTGATLLTVDINENGTTILSTKLTFDASELTTTTATTPAVISDSSLALDSVISIDIDSVGSTVAGAGLLVTLKGTITL
jgi:hypothetical protein